ncbi:polyphosphate kinase [Yersinia enterocolitica]|nr:polyphosphate kinase [Yersinia enterocolitica]HDL8438333.1 polyphosphate kinase [Yersinia enterocolitica]HDM8456716.1 polyphosphate kinase [Yersinia enterocolitica]HDW8047763.1 polyphosphate kinase [Yersinia enterocolitica]HEF9705879.1 polyphosphate kinase [Yersinia enterocolitica]
MLSKVCKERLEYLASLKGHVGQAVTMCRVELSDVSTELLSLREQLAELKALQPVGYVGNSDLYALSTGDLGCIAPYNAFEGIPLFTAAKPAEIPRHIYSMLVNELHDVPAIGCKRELIIGVLNRHGITAEPVQFDPPATE